MYFYLSATLLLEEVANTAAVLCSLVSMRVVYNFFCQAASLPILNKENNAIEVCGLPHSLFQLR